LTFEVYQRNDFILQKQIFDGEDALNLTGASLIFVVEHCGKEVLRITSENGDIVITNPLEGLVEMYFTAQHTDLPTGSYLTELLIVDVDGHRLTVVPQDIMTIKESLIAKE
jgi:hypothetical protein